MDLSFTKTAEGYVAEFTANAYFNLHLERPNGGKFEMKQRTTTSGQFANLDDLHFVEGKKVFDFDITSGLFPKTFKVVSETLPSVAVVTIAD